MKSNKIRAVEPVNRSECMKKVEIRDWQEIDKQVKRELKIERCERHWQDY